MVESGQYQRSRGGRGRLPEWARTKPKFRRRDDFFVLAYARLSSERKPFPGQVGPIPWRAIDDYGRRYRLGPLLHEWFVDVMMTLDRGYIEETTQEFEKQAAREQRRAGQKRKNAAQFIGNARAAAREPKW